MTNVNTALVGVFLLLLMGHVPAALADAKSVFDEHAAAQRIALIDVETTYTGDKEIRIFLRTQSAFLMENGSVVKTYRISSGAYSTPTPPGTFKIYKKQELRVSSQAVPYRMPKYMAFTPNEAFGMHALPYLGSNKESSAYWREARTHIGIPVSHGCVRFLPEEAEEIYDWAEVGVPVIIRS